MQPTTRRQFLAASAATAATAAALAPSQANADNHGGDTKFPEPAADAKFEAPYGEPLFKISVAQWSLNKLFWDKKVDNRDFGKTIIGNQSGDEISSGCARGADDQGLVLLFH